MDKKRFFYFLVRSYNDDCGFYITLMRTIHDLSGLPNLQRISHSVYIFLRQSSIDNGGLIKIIDDIYE